MKNIYQKRFDGSTNDDPKDVGNIKYGINLAGGIGTQRVEGNTGFENRNNWYDLFFGNK